MALDSRQRPEALVLLEKAVNRGAFFLLLFAGMSIRQSELTLELTPGIGERWPNLATCRIRQTLDGFGLMPRRKVRIAHCRNDALVA